MVTKSPKPAKPSPEPVRQSPPDPKFDEKWKEWKKEQGR